MGYSKDMPPTDEEEQLFELRRRRTRMLRAEFKTLKAFAAHIGESAGYAGRMLLTTPKWRKNIGEGKARKIEAKCGKSKGWLDQPIGSASSKSLTDARRDGWPFISFGPKVWDGLEPAEKRTAEAALLTIIIGLEALRNRKKDEK
jgi:hypothetical protein